MNAREAERWPGAMSAETTWSRRLLADLFELFEDPRNEIIGDPTIADAVLDRLVHNAHRLILKGESRRKTAAKRQKL